MEWKEFFKLTKTKIIISSIPLLYLAILFPIFYNLISKFDPELDTFFGISLFLYMSRFFFLWSPLNFIFCGTGLVQDCSGFLAFPRITLIGSILLGLINGIVLYALLSLFSHLYKKIQTKKNLFK